MLVSSFNLSQSFNYAPNLFWKKQFKSEINCFCIQTHEEAVRHEWEISNAGRKKPDFAERNRSKPVLLGLSLAENLVKPLMSLYGTSNGGSVTMDSEPIAYRKPCGGTELVFKLVCSDSSEIYHRLLLISFGKSQFKPLTI
jgi:hypothetical protein